MSLFADSSFWSAKGLHLWKKIGEGSFAKVYAMVARSEKDSVGGNTTLSAMKVIDLNYVSLKFRTKFLPRELNILLKLKHPFIVQVYCVFRRGAKIYINMEYAANGDMAEYLKTNTLTEPQMRSWLKEILLAIDYVHSLGVVHRDIKCENILLTENYNVRVADFGFARFLGPGRNPRTSTVCGTLSYSPPEVVLGKLPYNPVPADVWAVGVVLYRMANNGMPFRDKNKDSLYNKQMARDFAFRKSLNRSESLKALTASFMEPDVSKRVNIKNALRSRWIREADIRTPTKVKQAAEMGEARRNDLAVPVITPETLRAPSFHYRVSNHVQSDDSVINEFFKIIEPPLAEKQQSRQKRSV